MSAHNDPSYSEWSTRMYDLADKLAELDGFDPHDGYVNPDGSVTICGNLGPFTYREFYLVEASFSIGAPYKNS